MQEWGPDPVQPQPIFKLPQKWLKSMKYVKYNSYLRQTMWNHAKKLMKTLKRQNSLFFHCEISSVVLKTRKIRKTRQTKTRITQNFHILYPIQGGTMWKLTSQGFRKCGTFWACDLSNGSYCCPKSTDFEILPPSPKISGVKKKTQPQFWFFWSETNSTAS